MIRRVLFVGILVVLLGLSVTALAGSKAAEKKQDRQELKKDGKILDQNQRTLQALEHAIDLWHDANLKNEEKLARQYMTQIQVIIEADLAYSQKQLEQAQQEKTASNQEQSDPQESRYTRVDDHRDAVDDRADLHRIRDLYQAKKRLFSSINRGTSFSNRFRLLGDYVSVVKRQVNENKIELAEDISELHEDQHK
ncbi:MAG TPA: hypothetical protein PLF13_03090 [candidate division Zixibacteria bacterium]|nr:hypothetical protein [candidate division Zixibacteria bacterium]